MTPAADRAGRVLAIIGVLAIWVPFAALTGFLALWPMSEPGIGEADWPIFLLGLGVVLGLPMATWAALRRGAVASRLILVVIGVGVPVALASLLPAGSSGPVVWLTCAIVAGGALLALGGLLLIRTPATR